MIDYATSPLLRVVALGVAATAMVLGFAACSSDPASPTAQGSSRMLTVHANHGLTASKYNFKIENTTIASLGYGEWTQSLVENGGRSVKIFSTGGTEVASADVSLDSTHSTAVVFCGDDATREAFKVTSPKIAPAGGNAAIRLVHASNNAGDLVIKINSTNGLSFTTTALAYKNGTSYVELPVSSTDSLLVLKPGTTDVLLTITTKTLLSALKSYTIVMYGSTSVNADPAARLTSKMIQED